MVRKKFQVREFDIAINAVLQFNLMESSAKGVGIGFTNKK
jgi:hypothetical protein